MPPDAAPASRHRRSRPIPAISPTAGAAAALLEAKPDIVFHLAGIVSGEAESNFDLGYRVNLDGTRALFDAVRLAGHKPRVVYTSSIAVFGAPFPDVIYDDFQQTPLTSYGTQKLVGELILADYTRRGFFDGVGIRLPTICVRPGKPNKAASSFFSGIIREPLAGQEAILPVPRVVVHTHASPRSAVNFLIHAAGIDGAAIGPRRNLTMPGVGVTVGEQIEALRRIAGADVVKLIREEPDETIWKIVQNWPTRFEAKRARELGFAAEESFDEIVRAHIEDELGGKVAEAGSGTPSPTYAIRLADSSSRPTTSTKAAPSDLDRRSGCGCRCGRRRQRPRPSSWRSRRSSPAPNGDRRADRHGQHRQDAAGPQPVEEGEAQHDQRAGAGADADRRHRRPCRAPVETVAGRAAPGRAHANGRRSRRPRRRHARGRRGHDRDDRGRDGCAHAWLCA